MDIEGEEYECGGSSKLVVTLDPTDSSWILGCVGFESRRDTTVRDVGDRTMHHLNAIGDRTHGQTQRAAGAVLRNVW